MATFTFPSLRTLWTQTKALWSAERPDASIAPRSDVWLSTYIAAKQWSRLHKTAGRVLDAVFPSTTYGAYLDYWLTMLGASDGSGGLGRIIARGSSGGATDVTFTGVGTVTSGDLLTDPDGLTYEFVASYTSAGAETTAVAVDAVDTGSATNLESGVVLTISAPGANVTAASTLSTDLDDGADEETDAAGRARLLTLLRRGPSGSWSDWVAVIEAASAGNLDAYVWPKRSLSPLGWGRTDYCALQRSPAVTGSAKKIAAVDTLYTTIASAVTAAMPVLLVRNSRQLTLVNVGVPVECSITLSDGAASTSACDWDAEDIKATVASSVEGTKTITANVDLHLHVAVGDTIILDGQTATVASIQAGGDDKAITVDTWMWGAGGNPTVGYNIMSGGGLIQTAIDAIETDVFDAIGPERGTYAAPIPGWESDFKQLAVQSALVDAGDEEIVDVSVALPATNISHTEGNGPTAKWYVKSGEQITVWEIK